MDNILTQSYFIQQLYKIKFTSLLFTLFKMKEVSIHFGTLTFHKHFVKKDSLNCDPPNYCIAGYLKRN